MTDALTTRPSSPPRQRWYVQRGTWDRARVLEAFLEWTRRTGSPPTYYDWTPVQRAREAGVSLGGAAVWEREHPAWPSPSVVARHFDSWRALRLAAGVPGPEPITLPFAERVAEALRLRADGLAWKEIGELLGISPETARRYVHVHPCRECGAPVLRAQRCSACSSRNHTRWGRPFTREETVTAIQDWARLEGRAPAQVDWEPVDRDGHPRWERECPRYPPPAIVTRAFGSWNEALQAAGFDRPRPRAWTDSEILEQLGDWTKKHGHPPLGPEWDGAADRNSIARRFGGWNAALTAAGVKPRQIRRTWTDEEIVDGLRRFAADHGRLPRASDRVGALGQYPSPYVAVRRFGTWGAALTAAGLKPGNPPPATPELIVKALRSYRAQHGSSPTTTDWAREGVVPVADTIIRRCGSWAAALALAELPAPERPAHRISDAQLLDALRDYHRQHGMLPNADAWRRQRRRPAAKTIVRRFGSWSAAIERAGL